MADSITYFEKEELSHVGEEIIKHAQKNTGISVKALGELFNCGKMRVSRILKSKESLLACTNQMHLQAKYTLA